MAHPAWANVLALLVAATTSPATTRPADDEPGWSEPVDGLQIRLVAEKTVIDARELPRLAVELRNTNPWPLNVAVPMVFPVIASAGERSPLDGRGYNLLVTAEPTDGQRSIGAIVKVKAMHAAALLHPGDRISIDLKVTSGPLRMTLRQMKEVIPRPTSGPVTLRDEAEASFAYANRVGTYKLVATYAPRGRTYWQGEITSPPVELRVTPAPSTQSGK
jgi:hypothetical protein